MDIRNIGQTGNVERGGSRPKPAEAKRDYVIPTVGRDEARISASTRETAAAIDGLTERARHGDGDRSAKVAEAKQKLLSGALDTQVAYSGTAEQLLAGKFSSV